MHQNRNYSEVKYSGITINSPGHKQVCIELEKREIFFAFEAPVKPPGEENKIHRRIDLIVFLGGKYVFVEIDGRSNHVAENKRDDDHSRDRLIGRHGRVLRFTHTFALESPEKLVDMILDELEHSSYSSQETTTQPQELGKDYADKFKDSNKILASKLLSDITEKRQTHDEISFDDFFSDPDIEIKIQRALATDDREEAFKLRNQLFLSIEKMYDYLGYKKGIAVGFSGGEGQHEHAFARMFTFQKRGKGVFQFPELTGPHPLASCRSIEYLRDRFEKLSKK